MTFLTDQSRPNVRQNVKKLRMRLLGYELVYQGTDGGYVCMYNLKCILIFLRLLIVYMNCNDW